MLKLIPLFFLTVTFEAAPGTWDPLAPGMELGTFAIEPSSLSESSPLTILRIDPQHWDLEVVGTGGTGGPAGRTAKQWCESHDLTAAINAGMFATDYKTHVGYLRSRGHVHNRRVTQYRSVAAFHPNGGKASESRTIVTKRP